MTDKGGNAQMKGNRNDTTASVSIQLYRLSNEQ